jgi:sphinganine-1-phosphate aldolase
MSGVCFISLPNFLEMTSQKLREYHPFTLIISTLLTVCLIAIIGKFWQLGVVGIVGNLLRVLRKAPGIGSTVAREQEKISSKLQTILLKYEQRPEAPPRFFCLPERGLDTDTLFRYLYTLREFDQETLRHGKLSGKVYNDDPKVLELISRVYGMFTVSNALHSDIYPSSRRCESEIIKMTARMLHASATNDICGCMTSGGTDSIFMAMKTYRDWARHSLNISEPEVLMPVTAHPAFDKAAHYLNMKLVKVPIGDDYRVNVNEVARRITRNTVLVVGSAPNYPHGIIDDIAALGKVVAPYRGRIGLHVDACLGGFVLPWAFELKSFGVPPFDFTVPEVTSISVDTHKYGFAPKGTSVLLFRFKTLRSHMYFVQPNWPGGVYATPALAGSRPGALIVATWAVMLSLGATGYRECAEQIMHTQRTIKEGIQRIDGLCVIGDPVSPIVAFTTSANAKFDIYQVADAMRERHWHLDVLQRPKGLHLCVTMKHVGRAEEYLRDLRESVAAVCRDPTRYKSGLAPVYGVIASMPDRSLIEEFAHTYLDLVLDL